MINRENKVFVRAKPEKIAIEERYFYHTDIGDNKTMEFQRAEGEVQLNYPYDGEKFFDEDALADLKSQCQGDDPLQVTVGHLNLHGNLSASWIQALEHNALSIVLPVNDIKSKVECSQKCVLRYKYSIEEPASPPVVVGATIIDGEPFSPDAPPTSFEDKMRLDLLVDVRPAGIRRAEETLEELVRWLIEQGESEEISLLPPGPKTEELAQTLVAMANDRGGYILIGKEKNGWEPGLTEEELDEARATLQEAVMACMPPVPILIPRTVVIGEKSILFTRLQSDLSDVYKFKGDCWRREGTTNQKLSDNEFIKLRFQRHKPMAGEPVSVGQVSTDDVSSLLTQAPGPTLYFVWEEKEMAIEYLGETIVALANNQGGHILIGVRPLPEGGTCQILGIEELKAKEVMSRVSNAAAGCRPPVQIFGPKLLVMEGKNVVVVKIAGGLPYVYSFAGRVLTRREADNENPADAIYQQVIERSRTTVRELSDEVRPVASYIRLDWPYVSYVTAASARFDPEKRALEWRDLFLQPEGEDHYRCKVSIPIERPKELYRQREIKGEIRLQFRNVTLSGLRLDYFNALGEGRRSPHALLGDLPKLERIGRAVSAQQSAGVEIERFAKGWGRSQLQALRDSLHKLERAGRTRSTQQPAKVKIERSTTIIVDTAITVDSIFKRREFFPYRHVELGGIIPEPNRLNDILNILNDLGIRVEIWPDPATGSEAFLKQMEHGFQISGVKRTGAEELKVSMVVKGFRSGLTRQVTLGRRKDTLRLNTGNLVIDIFGSVQGDFKQLSALLSEIQKVLKERLEFVRVT